MWEGTGRYWNFSGARTDQGALYYLFHYKLRTGGYLDPFTYGYDPFLTR